MKFYTFALFVYLLFPFGGIAQQTTADVKGTVVDQNNQTVVNATIKSLVTGNKAVTDREGGFTLITALPDTLLITRIGHERQQQVVAESIAEIRIVLLRIDQQIEEVVVHTGYQSLKPNEVNGSVTVIDNEMLNLQNGTNILQRLNGVSNGLSFNTGKRNTNPQNRTNIMVRGHSTINGPLDPLIVLDNFVYEGDIENINPDDVESVTILKDASATSIYGARGGNGVIVITTKRGRFNQPVQVDIRASTMITDIPDLSPLRGMDNKDYIEVERMLYERGNFNADINGIVRPALSPVVDVLYRKDSGLLSEEEAQARIREYEQVDFLKQYSNAFYRKGNTRQYNVGLRGGSDKHNWNISASLNNVLDNTRNTSDRINLRLSNTLKVKEWMSVGVDAQVNSRKSQSGVIPSIDELRRFGSRNMVPYVPLYGNDGTPIPVYNKYNSVYLDTVGNGRLQDWRYYPIAERSMQQTINHTQEMIGVFLMEVRPFDGFNIRGAYQYQRQIADVETFHDRNSYVMRDMVNRFAQINQTTGVVTYPVPLGDRLVLQSKNIASQQFRLQSNYDKKWEKHNINGILGFEVREVKSTGDNAWIYGYNRDPLSRVAVNHIVAFPQRPAGIATITGGAWPDANIVNRFVSLYGNAYYSFRDRYSVSGSFRRDGSNIYGVTTNDKWKPLWSVGLGYEISKESFFNSEFMEYLKLRTTLGYSGNVDLSRSALPIAGYSNGEAALGALPTARIGTLNNPSLRWEQVQQINFGLDFRTWKGRFSGTLEYYTKESTDLYGPAPFDYTTWGVNPTVVMNAADLAGRGVDIQLRVAPIQNDFIWNSSIIFNYNTAKTKRYHLTSTQVRSDIDRIIGTDGSIITPVEGMPLYAIAAYRWGGLDAEGSPQGYLDGGLSTDYVAIRNDVREHGVNNSNARYIGSAAPIIFGSWLNEISYKNVGLSWNITYRTGYYFRRQSIHYEALINRGYGHFDYANRWQKAGDEMRTSVPAFQYPTMTAGRDDFYALSEELVEKADHIRLQFVNLFYNLKTSGRLLPKSTRFFINASDLGILWSANNNSLDPDYAYEVRPARTISIGLSTNF